MPDKTYSCESVCLTYLAPRKRERIPISRKLNVDRLPRSDSPSIMEAIRLHRSQLNLIRSFHSTQRLLYTNIFTHDNFYTQKLLHTDTFTQSNFYTQELLHIHTFTHRNFYRRNFLQTESFTDISVYTQTLSRAQSFYKQMYLITFVVHGLTSCRPKRLFRSRENHS